VALCLANSLSETAKSVFDLLDLEMIGLKEYQFIKTSLLKAFNVDEESCKAKFDNAKCFQRETVAQNF